MARGSYKFTPEQQDEFEKTTGVRYTHVQEFGGPNRKQRRAMGQRNPRRPLAPLGKGI